MVDFIQTTLPYSTESGKRIDIQFSGTADAVHDFIHSGTRGEMSSPIRVSTQVDGEWTTIPPSSEYWASIDALRNSLSKSRSADEPDPVEEKGYFLHPGLIPYINELPEWMQERLVFPIPGILNVCLLLPPAVAGRWREAIEHLRTIQDIVDEYLVTDSIARPFIAPQRPARSRSQTMTVDGVVVVSIEDDTDQAQGCARYEVQDQGAYGNVLHYYTLEVKTAPVKIGVLIKAGEAKLRLDRIRYDQLKMPTSKEMTKPVHKKSSSDAWEKEISDIRIGDELGVYIRNITKGGGRCTYRLIRECTNSEFALDSDRASG